MDIINLEKSVSNIQVRNLINADVEVINDSPLVMIGKGRQGAVFQVSDDICVKVFGNTEDCEREYVALSLGQQTNLFPRTFGKGPLYIAMEIVNGVDLREYLQSQPLTSELSHKLIQMLITFKEIGFERIDHHKRQIFLQPDGNLKVIDVARTIWRDRVYPYPRKLLTSLGEENKALFLSHVQELAPRLYEEWKYYIQMEDLSRQIYQKLINQNSKTDKLKKLTGTVLTTHDEQDHVVKLEGLLHKVFKEEWVKTMLAQGKDPDKVMEKIDKYWESKEKNHNQELTQQKTNSIQMSRGDKEKAPGKKSKHEKKKAPVQESQSAHDKNQHLRKKRLRRIITMGSGIRNRENPAY